MSDDFYQEYFSYLKQRSTLGYLYRNYWLYPKLFRHLRGRVLDVGCGIGDLLRYRKDTIGVDVNPEAVKYCQSQGLDAYLMKADKLPFDSGTFDSIILDNVLEHIEDPAILLREIERVLVVDGCVVFGVPGSKGFASDADHKVFYSKNKLIKVLANSGFVADVIFSMPFSWKYLDKTISQYCIYGVFNKTDKI